MALAVVAGDGHGLIPGAAVPQVDDLDARAAQQVHAVMHPVVFTENDACDAGLDDEFAALHAGRCRDIERCTLAAVVAPGHFGDGVGLGMQHVGLGVVGILLTHVLKPRRRAVVTVADDHLVLDQQRAHLTAAALGILGPDLRHAQVSGVEQHLFFLASVHFFVF